MSNINKDMKEQCVTMLNSAYLFEQGLKIAALKDDGIISKEEAKALKEITKAVNDLKKVLEKYGK